MSRALRFTSRSAAVQEPDPSGTTVGLGAVSPATLHVVRELAAPTAAGRAREEQAGDQRHPPSGMLHTGVLTALPPSRDR